MSVWEIRAQRADIVGYWEPHTATIDFCETNYVYSPYICELWNSVTGFWIVYLGLYGLVKGIPAHVSSRNPRYVILWMLVIAVGLGTVLLHGALIRPFQAADEIPMMLCNVAMWYTSHTVKQDWPAIALCAVACVALLTVYFVFEMFVVFFVLFSSFQAYLIFRQLMFCFSSGAFAALINRPLKDPYTMKSLVMFRMASVRLLLWFYCAFALWLWESFDCERVEQFHFHVWWHIGAGMGSYWMVLSIIILHLSRSDAHFSLTFGGPLNLLGVLDFDIKTA